MGFLKRLVSLEAKDEYKVGHVCLFTIFSYADLPYLPHGWTKEGTPTMLPACWDLPQFPKQETGREKGKSDGWHSRKEGTLSFCAPRNQGF